MNIQEYFSYLQERVGKEYALAGQAREKGLDPVSKVETPIAMTLAEKTVGLISTIYPQINDIKIINRINELEKEYGPLDMAVPFKIAEEIAREKFCKFTSLLEAMDAGIRVGFSYITIGVVSSPLEGFTEIKTQKTRNGEDYIVAYFSGPIRSAGTTASCMVLMLIDYLRETFGFAKYDATEDEVKRYVSENYEYHERVNNLQYLPTEEEIEFLARNIPIQISGEPSEKREVPNYKDLPRIETNFIRGGMCLCFSEGLAQKAQKGFGLWKPLQAKGFKLTGWEFLSEYIKIHKKREKGSADATATYIKDLVAGRPIYGHPSASGGFRFRYGRCRTSGFSADAVHPATMAITNQFLSFGVQLKTEKPTKGCVVSSCDEMDGPVVKLKDGSVRKLKDFDEAKALYKDTEEIIYLGDILVPFGDVVNRKFELLRTGYVEEWWELELKKAAGEEFEKLGIRKFDVGFEKAAELSRKFKIPLHPSGIYYWKEISYEQFLSLLDWLARGSLSEGKLILPYTRTDKERFAKGKRALELIGCEHLVTIENVVLNENDCGAILANLGIDHKTAELEKEFDAIMKKLVGKEFKDVLEAINSVSLFKIKDKSGTFIGSRMGRPEKAKTRKLIGSPHVIFPVGEEGGRLRSVQVAAGVGSVEAEFSVYYCHKCSSETIYPKCEVCGGQCEKLKYCPDDEKNYLGNNPDGKRLFDYKRKKIDFNHYFGLAKKMVGARDEEIPLIKGVRGTSNADHSCENLAKGILRARHAIQVNKDGTVRYDMTEMPITHFKPKEIGTSAEKLRELGYAKDIFGKEITSDEQVLEMFPHDIILPSCPDSDDEGADKIFLRVTQFVDEELEKFYGLPRFYYAQKREDLLGQLVVCIAPHICTASVGRIIGFSKTQTLLASPFMHAAMRRDCDGDEAAAILLLDMLLNFSKKFLPSHRGGTQDAPLVLNTYIRAGDVDDQILDLDTEMYPLEFYEMTEQGKHSTEVKCIENVRRRLKEGKNSFVDVAFTHGCDDFNRCTVNSAYKSIPTMQEKVDKQMELCAKIRAVDTKDVARLIIERHFIRDTRGNLRKFSMQAFRCTTCNESYRRPPLAGKCTKCGGRLIFTISEGSVLKYMESALNLARTYDVSPYLLESLELTEMYIQSIFGRDKDKQEALKKWFG